MSGYGGGYPPQGGGGWQHHHHHHHHQHQHQHRHPHQHQHHHHQHHQVQHHHHHHHHSQHRHHHHHHHHQHQHHHHHHHHRGHHHHQHHNRQPQATRLVNCDIGASQPSPIVLQQAFVCYGLLEKINARQLRDGRFQATITYSSVRAAERVLKMGQVNVGGTMRNVSPSTQHDAGCVYDRAGAYLWVGFCGRSDITQDDVGRALSKFGDIQKVEMHHEEKHNNYAIVTYCHIDHAREAYKSTDKIKNVTPFIEWFHPGEEIGGQGGSALPPSLMNIPVVPQPEETRKLVFKYALTSPIMEDELSLLIGPQYGEIDKIAMGLEDDFKIAHVVFEKQASAANCKAAFDNGSLNIPGCPNLSVDWGMVTTPAPVVQAPQGPTPSSNICLQYSSREDLENIGLEAIRAVFETRVGGIDNVQMKDKYAFINFKEVRYGIMAIDQFQTLNVPGNPIAKYARKTTSTAPQVSAMPTMQNSTPALPSQKEAEAVLAKVTFGGGPPTVLPAKSARPPADSNLVAKIDSHAKEYARNNKLTPEGEMIMRTDTAGYFRWKTEWIKLGIDHISVEALTAVRLEAEAVKRAKDEENDAVLAKRALLPDYTSPGETPIANDMKVLIIGETNLTFSVALLTRFMNKGSEITVTTRYSKEQLVSMYPEAQDSVKSLIDGGVNIGYDFDPTAPEGYEEYLKDAQFDAIVINFPVATDESGTHVMDTDENQTYVRRIFKYSTPVLAPKGLFLVAQFDCAGYSDWQLSKLAQRADTGLRLINKCPFRTSEYPGYVPVFATFDEAAQFRSPTLYIFGRKKKYLEAYDKLEEREVELDKIKEQRRRRRRETSSSSSDGVVTTKRGGGGGSGGALRGAPIQQAHPGMGGPPGDFGRDRDPHGGYDRRPRYDRGGYDDRRGGGGYDSRRDFRPRR